MARKTDKELMDEVAHLVDDLDSVPPGVVERTQGAIALERVNTPNDIPPSR